jgi:hypothetical protein
MKTQLEGGGKQMKESNIKQQKQPQRPKVQEYKKLKDPRTLGSRKTLFLWDLCRGLIYMVHPLSQNPT